MSVVPIVAPQRSKQTGRRHSKRKGRTDWQNVYSIAKAFKKVDAPGRSWTRFVRLAAFYLPNASGEVGETLREVLGTALGCRDPRVRRIATDALRRDGTLALFDGSAPILACR